MFFKLDYLNTMNQFDHNLVDANKPSSAMLLLSSHFT
jgi:hypothetical protein